MNNPADILGGIAIGAFVAIFSWQMAARVTPLLPYIHGKLS